MEPQTDEPDSSSPGFSKYSKTAFVIFFFFIACNQQLKENNPAVFLITHHFSQTPVELLIPEDVKKNKKKIYITFDDGPNKGTSNVLDIVKEEEIPVTFFIVGEHVFASKEQQLLWDSLNSIQHIEICNHSFTHAWHNKFEKFYQYPDSVIKDFQRAHDSLQLKNKIVRTPGRNMWRIDSLHVSDIKKSKAAVDSLQKAGFIIMGWDLEWHYDHKTLQVKNTGEELINQIDSVFTKGKTKFPDNLVLLAHDQVYKNSNDSLQLRQFIQLLKQKDEYELMLVSNYPALKPLPDSIIVKTFVQPGSSLK